MGIEISDEYYWKVLTWQDGLLYCSLLSIDGKMDWRMINRQDYFNSSISNKNNPSNNGICFGDVKQVVLGYEYWVIPVSDV